MYGVVKHETYFGIALVELESPSRMGVRCKLVLAS
jgi:hypothetical protein